MSEGLHKLNAEPGFFGGRFHENSFFLKNLCLNPSLSADGRHEPEEVATKNRFFC